MSIVISNAVVAGHCVTNLGQNVIFRCFISVLAASIFAAAASAENELSIFAGAGIYRPGTLTYDIKFDATADDADASMSYGSLFVGMRYTHWVGSDGIGLEYSRDFRSPSDPDQANQITGSDGSILTLNYHKAFPEHVFDPYVGLGVGVLNTPDTHLAGPAMRFSAGGRYALNESIDVMAEYQFTYSQDLQDREFVPGRSAEKRSNALNFGISFGF